jgi:hypothetical protein
MGALAVEAGGWSTTKEDTAMRTMMLLAGLALVAGLGACSSRTTYVERPTAPPPTVVQQAPPTVVTPPPTVTVRPNY